MQFHCSPHRPRNRRRPRNSPCARRCPCKAPKRRKICPPSPSILSIVSIPSIILATYAPFVPSSPKTVLKIPRWRITLTKNTEKLASSNSSSALFDKAFHPITAAEARYRKDCQAASVPLLLCTLSVWRHIKDNSAVSGKVMHTVINNLAYHMKALSCRVRRYVNQGNA